MRVLVAVIFNRATYALQLRANTLSLKKAMDLNGSVFMRLSTGTAYKLARTVIAKRLSNALLLGGQGSAPIQHQIVRTQPLLLLATRNLALYPFQPPFPLNVSLPVS